MCDHEFVTQATWPDDATREEISWCKLCGKSLEEIEEEKTPHFGFYQQSPIG